MTEKTKNPKPSSTNSIMIHQIMRNKEKKPYKLPETKTKSKGSQIRMASAPQEHSRVEENGAILSKF